MNKSFFQLTLFLAIFTYLFFVPNSIYCQGFEPVSKKGKFNIGAEGGVQFTNIKSYNGFYQPRSKVGFSAGLFGEYYISNVFKVKIGAYYDNRAFELYGERTFADTSNTQYSHSYHLYQVDYKLNYLTIPIGIGYERGSDKFKLILQLNFYYSIFLNSNMKGNELYYIDPADGFDLSEFILNQGLNEFQISGSTEGIAATDISKDRKDPYKVERFNSSDFGLSFLLGGQYQMTPKTGLLLSLGFSYSMSNLFENPEIESKWRQITKINLGFVFTLD